MYRLNENTKIIVEGTCRDEFNRIRDNLLKAFCSSCQNHLCDDNCSEFDHFSSIISFSKPRREFGLPYYYIYVNNNNSTMLVKEARDERAPLDDFHLNKGNYFLTFEEAQKALDKINAFFGGEEKDYSKLPCNTCPLLENDLINKKGCVKCLESFFWGARNNLEIKCTVPEKRRDYVMSLLSEVLEGGVYNVIS